MPDRSQAMHADVARRAEGDQPGWIVQPRPAVMDVETRRIPCPATPAAAIAVENGFTISVKV